MQRATRSMAWKKYLIELLPIPIPSVEVEKKFITALDCLLAQTSSEQVENYIQKINHLVYKTIGFTTHEIETIERIVSEGAH